MTPRQSFILHSLVPEPSVLCRHGEVKEDEGDDGREEEDWGWEEILGDVTDSNDWSRDEV